MAKKGKKKRSKEDKRSLRVFYQGHTFRVERKPYHDQGRMFYKLKNHPGDKAVDLYAIPGEEGFFLPREECKEKLFFASV